MNKAKSILEQALHYKNCDGLIEENSRLEDAVLYAINEALQRNNKYYLVHYKVVSTEKYVTPCNADRLKVFEVDINLNPLEIESLIKNDLDELLKLEEYQFNFYITDIKPIS